MIILVKIVFKIAKINYKNEILIERIILKTFNNFFKNLKMFIVSKEFQMNKRYNINEFLQDKNKIEIENEIENSNDYDNDNIDLK